MYEKIVQVKQEVLLAFLGLLDKEAKNDLQCLVTWDGTHSTIFILDEPPGTRMYVNGEWSVRDDVDRMAYEIFVTSEDLRQNSEEGYSLAESVDAVIRSHVRSLWNIRVDEYERCAKLVAEAFDIDLTKSEDHEEA